MAIVLKRAEVRDAEALAELRLEMRREREAAPCPMPEEEFYRINLAFFREHIADGSFISFLAWDGEQAVACSGLSIHAHPPTYTNPSGKIGYITNMFTRPAWRRMGIAGQLVDKLAETARVTGCGKLFLNASPMGRPVYARYGFREVEGEMCFTPRS